ncbi:hypothetical protein MVEN_01963600 [Mycena venus]|uniref:F-box domain-containing protein n=1 Tax=Mycena venus TaxID=2733690 RepID=A0A8H7CK23_9AGAR|nr:hypothetical protein MVEN_01963600 [Mycena venus]
MVPRTGILDLPTEILVYVLDNPSLSTSTLYSVALSCRRLHFLALQIYFHRYGLTPTSKSIVIDMRSDRRDVLAALQTALFIPQTEVITFVFPHPSCTSISPLLRHLTRAEDYISRLPSVKHVTLCLDGRGSVCLSVGDDRELRAWTTRLESLLACIVKKQCECLTMINGGQFTRAYELVPPIPRRSPIKRLLSTVLGLQLQRRIPSETQDFRRVSKQGRTHIEMTLPTSLHPASRLSILEIHSAILVLPPGLCWTLTVLRTCPITSLKLERRVEDSIPWGTVLPLIGSAAGRLTSLTLVEASLISGGDTDSFSEADVLDFISRLPQLRHITVSYKNRKDLRESDGPLIHLQDLEILRAPSTFILHLLRSPSPLPNIQSICVLWPETYDARGISYLATALPAFLQKPDPPRLSVSVSSAMYRSPFLTFPTDDTRAFLDRVEGLEITSSPFPLTDLTEMAGWISLFPRVRQVEVALSDSKSPDFRSDLTCLLGAVKATDFLDKIKVNGELYNLLDDRPIPTSSRTRYT